MCGRVLRRRIGFGSPSGRPNRKEQIMSATTLAAPVSATRAWVTMRHLLLALAVVVLLATAFVVGRTTAYSSTTRVPAVSRVSNPASNPDTYTPHCVIGAPC